MNTACLEAKTAFHTAVSSVDKCSDQQVASCCSTCYSFCRFERLKYYQGPLIDGDIHVKPARLKIGTLVLPLNRSLAAHLLTIEGLLKVPCSLPAVEMKGMKMNAT